MLCNPEPKEGGKGCEVGSGLLVFSGSTYRLILPPAAATTATTSLVIL